MDPYTRAMFGCNAAHCGANMIVQDAGDGRVLVVLQSTSQQPKHPLMFGSQHIHQLLMGDIVFRPRVVLGSDHLRGQGINHIARCGFDLEEWMDADVVLDPTGEIEKITGKPTPREMV